MEKKENKPASFEEEKEMIIKMIKKIRDENTERLIEAMNNAYASNQQEERKTESNNTLKLWQQFMIPLNIIVLALFISLILPPSSKFTECLNEKMLFGFLAFVIALASYIASVARQIVEKLSEKKTEKDNQKLKLNLFFLISGEIPVVVLGLLVTIRIYTGSYITNLQCIHTAFSFDAFLISLLSTIIFYLAFLHGRIWFSDKTKGNKK